MPCKACLAGQARRRCCDFFACRKARGVETSVSISTATVDEHACQAIAQRLQRVHEEIISTLENPAVEPVHDLRVSIRRALQALRLFSRLLPAGETRRIRRTLKATLTVAGQIRDLDVGAELLVAVKLEAANPIFAAMAAERQRAVYALLGRLYLLRADTLPLAWLPLLDRIAPGSRAAGDMAREVLPPIALKFFEAGRNALVGKPSAEKLHALRLAAKRFRYTLELWEPFYGPVYVHKLERVRHIQSILGKRQDCAVIMERLAPLCVLDPQLQAAHERVASRAARQERAFYRYWHVQFDALGEQERWLRYLARRLPARRPRLPGINPAGY